ncbi:hypothetical protein DICSQDRAFT_178972 [Dichomitus squalens LYAD-421 SS1]|uniref:Tetraspanin/Peripherin n=1 Tax=Dichomitus squalens TaxID=114155 RepID=A0A4Q9PXM2_9APHY|nr:uncharacterized protein DICSQDRAFT_178972 [Dichomitus squalens LYAD-421 SS1]EJF63700.1 hypothetical protein DICSQDRAFT_178972 [Dichomitus squalens LYAD-421 SS1]TBU59266.1 hypothetical protein BD310DRAFT_925205 [Dichomitus squalens]
MSKHFCCCIPVRAAVFFFSLLSFLASGLSAALAWYLLFLIDNNRLDEVEKNLNENDKQAFDAVAHKYKWGIIVGGLIFTLIALMSFFGFVGSIIRNRRMVKAYSFMTIFIFILGTVAAGFTLFATYNHKPICVTINNEQVCTQSHLSLGQKIGYTVYVVIEWLIELYIIVIIRRYYDQLEEEREYRHEFRLNPTTSGTYEAKEGLLTQGHYPYTDNHNAFGAHNHA